MYNYNSKVYPTPRLDPVRLRFALEARGETPEDQPVSQADAQAELEERNWCSTSSRTGVFSWDVSGQTLSMFPNLQSYLSAGAKASNLNPIDAVHVFLVSCCTVCFQPHPSPWAVSNKWVSSAAGETAEEGREVWEEAATKEGNTGGLGRRGGTRLERSNGRGGFDAAMEKHDVYELNIFKWAIFHSWLRFPEGNWKMNTLTCLDLADGFQHLFPWPFGKVWLQIRFLRGWGAVNDFSFHGWASKKAKVRYFWHSHSVKGRVKRLGIQIG